MERGRLYANAFVARNTIGAWWKSNKWIDYYLLVKLTCEIEFVRWRTRMIGVCVMENDVRGVQDTWCWLIATFWCRAQQKSIGSNDAIALRVSARQQNKRRLWDFINFIDCFSSYSAVASALGSLTGQAAIQMTRQIIVIKGTSTHELSQ